MDLSNAALSKELIHDLATLDIACPLCQQKNTRFFNQDEHREYMRCDQCQLVFVPAVYHMPVEPQSHSHSLKLSQNGKKQNAKVTHLVNELSKRLPQGARGLDYGSGPSPVLPATLIEKGFAMEIYDPFFAPDRGVLAGSYDFLTCSKTIEHFRDPAQDWKNLLTLVRPGGLLGLTVSLRRDKDTGLSPNMSVFADKVTFYTESTLRWLVNQYQLKMVFKKEGVILLRQKMGA